MTSGEAVAAVIGAAGALSEAIGEAKDKNGTSIMESMSVESLIRLMGAISALDVVIGLVAGEDVE